jgi:hypothetical protein
MSVENETCKTIPGMGGGGERTMIEGVSSTMIYLIYVRTFVNVSMYPQYNNKK